MLAVCFQEILVLLLSLTGHPIISLCRLFKQTISLVQSSVKISDQTPRDDPKIIDTVAWSSGLDKIFIQNLGNDSDLRYGVVVS